MEGSEWKEPALFFLPNDKKFEFNVKTMQCFQVPKNGIAMDFGRTICGWFCTTSVLCQAYFKMHDCVIDDRRHHNCDHN